jgi:hypothetical protein
VCRTGACLTERYPTLAHAARPIALYRIDSQCWQPHPTKLKGTDMSRYEIELRLDAPGVETFGGALSKESERARTRVYRELGLKVHSNAWVKIDLSSASGMNKVQKLIEECKAGQVTAGTAIVYEHLDKGESTAADWSYLYTRTANDSFSLWDDYPSYKSSELAATHAFNNTFVSSQFVDICERAGLRGVSFLRCRKRGRKHGPAWFVALPDNSLGRGLDHRWFDRRSWLQEVGDHPDKRSSSLHVGQSNFHQRWSRIEQAKDARFLQPLLKLFPMSRAHDSGLLGLSFVTVPRFWTKVLPDADFAYVPLGEDGQNREGKMMRFRQLMVSRHARRVLIEAGLFPEKRFLGVHSVASPEEGVEILDQSHDPVAPMYTAEELVALRSLERDPVAK